MLDAHDVLDAHYVLDAHDAKTPNLLLFYLFNRHAPWVYSKIVSLLISLSPKAIY